MMGLMAMPTAPPSTTTHHPPKSGFFWGQAKISLSLYDSAGGGRVVGSVPAGQRLLVVKQAGLWVLVSHNQGGSLVKGWTLTDAIASD